MGCLKKTFFNTVLFFSFTKFNCAVIFFSNNNNKSVFTWILYRQRLQLYVIKTR